ncbi:hypothetical protein JW948_07960 [bacterium]|nr:hypothetical protein [bacterium]
MKCFYNREEGQTLGEFVLIFLLIVLVVIVALTFFGTSLLGLWSRISTAF